VEATRADVLMGVNREDEAKALIQEVLEQDPKNVQVRETLGMEALRKGSWEDARKWLEEAVKVGSQDYETNYNLAELLLRNAPTEGTQIEACLRTAIRANPGEARTYDMLAHYELMEHVKLEDALKLSNQAVRLDPGNVGYRETAAFVMERMKKFSDAENMLHSAMLVARSANEKESVQVRRSELQQMEQAQAPQPLNEMSPAAANGVIDVPAADAGGPGRGAGPVVSDELQSAGAGLNGQTASAPGMVTLPPQGSQHPDKANGPKHIAEGVMRQVHCGDSGGIEFELEGKKKTVKVYNNRIVDLAVTASGFTPAGTMNPCADFEGMKAEIEYAVTTDKTVDGKVLAIMLMK
jgi:cytochrome c-type biogenesis protein CcmH/NrfG